MEDIEGAVELDTESVHLVEITHYLNPYDFYVRPTKYRSIIQEWESTITKTKATTFNVQDFVIINLYYSRGGYKYIRGRITRILKIDNILSFDVFAIDYGFTEKSIPIEYIWECSQEMANIPPLAYNCRLANCYPMESEGFTTQTNDAFKDLVGSEPVKIKVRGKKPNKILVDLINSAEESIAIQLAIDGYATICLSIEEMVKNPFIHGNRVFFDFKEVKIGETLHVRVLSGDSLNAFHVARVIEYDKYVREIDIKSFFADREATVFPEHLIEGKLVCVNVDKERSKYERAFIKEVTIPQEKAIVHLVDWGIDREFHVEEMKYMPAKCLSPPVLSIYCQSEENQAWDNGLDRFLSPGYEFKITIKSLGQHFKYPNKVDISPATEEDDDIVALPDDILDE